MSLTARLKVGIIAVDAPIWRIQHRCHDHLHSTHATHCWLSLRRLRLLDDQFAAL